MVKTDPGGKPKTPVEDVRGDPGGTPADDQAPPPTAAKPPAQASDTEDEEG